MIAGSIILGLALFCLGVALASRVYLLIAEANLANIILAVYMVYGLLFGGVLTAVGLPLLIAGLVRRKKALKAVAPKPIE